MKNASNIEAVKRVAPDYLGFIFYPESPRYMGKEGLHKTIAELPSSIEKVGVFVNAEVSEVMKAAREYGLDLVQLHGDESPDVCNQLKMAGYKIIKVFRIEKDFDFHQLKPYEHLVDFFLFDTRGQSYGGNGIPFDWEVLNGYPLQTPYFLSGGVGLENIHLIRNFDHENLVAIDVNSRVEIEPGLKDLGKVTQLKDELKKLNN